MNENIANAVDVGIRVLNSMMADGNSGYANQTMYKNSDTTFEDIQKQFAKDGIDALACAPAAAPIFLLQTLLIQAGEVAKYTEVQKTARKGIEAERDVAVKRIDSQKEILLAYLEKTFDERKENFSKLFDVIDHSIESGNMDELAMALDGVIRLAETSPFKDLRSVQGGLEDPNMEWDI
jgi:hypothetical protein